MSKFFSVGHTTVCPYCLYPITSDQRSQSCSGCQSPYHQECWEHLGGCAVYGCPKMKEVKKAEDEPATIWGASEKVCPLCAENIPVKALQCPYCKTQFTGIRPMDREEFLKKSDDPVLVKCRKRAMWLLVLSVLGVTSPLTLLIGSIWYRSKKNDIERAGPTVQGMTLIALAIPVIYMILIGFGLLVFWLKVGEM